ncbi:hypothetical protein L5515_009932 [Caenorhabditis briggsae]|uniref:Domain of unknown function WSN domain-containing protein n=1 Tax=Caenorhabditis briggsae TaxID=6238 RepID=A0AAE9FA11_CAEBR|nr:hypothetical protein L5515_009932 [Caenorhabditis briggsae]
MNIITVSLIAFLCKIITVTNVNLDSNFNNNEQKRKFDENLMNQSLDRLTMIARVTNGIYLQKGIMDGIIPTDNLISELLQSVEIDKVEKIDVEKIEAIFEALEKTQTFANSTSQNVNVTSAENSSISSETIRKVLEFLQNPRLLNKSSFLNLRLLVIQIINPRAMKPIVHTFGFPNGYHDLIMLSKDFEDPWLQAIVRTKSLEFSIKPLIGLGVVIKNISEQLNFTEEQKNIVFEVYQDLKELVAKKMELTICNFTEISSKSACFLAQNLAIQDYESMIKGLKRFKEAQSGLKSLNTSIKTMKFNKNLETEALKHFSGSLRHSEILGYAVQGVISMRLAIQEEPEFQQIIPKLSIITAQLIGNSSQEDQKNLEELAKMGPHLEAMYSTLNTWKFSSFIEDNSTNLLNYSKIFENAQLVTGIELNFSNIAISLNNLIAGVGDEEVREKLKDIETVVDEMNEIGLNFSRYSKIFKEVNGTMQALNVFFVDYDTKIYDPIIAKERNKDYTAMYTLIGVGAAIFVIVFFLGLLYLWRKDKEIENFGESRNEKTKKEISRKSGSNSEETLLTGKNFSTSSTTH